MKRHIITWGLILGASLFGTQLDGQTLSEESERKARELLKAAIEQRGNPAAKAPPRVAPAPIVTTPVVRTPERPVGTLDGSTTGLRGTPQPSSFGEVEQAYLSGKITARQFQKYLKDKTLEVNASANSPKVEDQAVAMLRQSSVRTNVNAPLLMSGRPTGQPAVAATPNASTVPAPKAPEISTPEAPVENAALSEVEKKMDELLKAKAAREQAALQAAAVARTNAASAAPKTKRERMDDLLKQYIGGKISEADYKAKRQELMGEAKPAS